MSLVFNPFTRKPDYTADPGEVQYRHPSVTFVVASSTSDDKDLADYVCDGTNDDVQINAAIAALPSGKGTVQLLEGQFVISSPIVLTSPAQNLIGNGINSTEIYVANNANIDAIQVDVDSLSQWLLIKSMTINGNKANNTSGRGIFTGVGSSTIQDLKFQDLFISSFSSHGMEIADQWGMVVDNVTIEFCEGDGIRIATGSDGKIFNCKIISNSGTAIRLNSNTVGTTKIQGNLLSGGEGEYGIYADGSRHIIIGNEIYDEDVTTAFEGIHIVGDDLDIIGNDIHEDTFLDGIVLVAGADNNFIFGNSIETSNTTISDSGSSNFIANKSIDGEFAVTSGNFGIGIENPSAKLHTYGTVKLADDATGDVILFGGVDVGDADSGKRLEINRKAAEGDNYIRLNIDSSQRARIVTDASMIVNTANSGYFHFFFDTSGTPSLRIGSSWQANSNADLLFYGYLTAAAANKYIKFQLDDTDDYFHLSRQDANVLGFKVDMPFQADDYYSGDGTQGATGSFLDQGGNTITVKDGLITAFS